MIAFDLLTQIGISAGVQVVLLTIISFFGEKIFSFYFSKNIEIKKLELNKDLEDHKQLLTTNTENYKSDLNKSLELHKSQLVLLNTKYSKLHDKQSQIIAELYKRIVNLQSDFDSMTATMRIIYTDAQVEEEDRVNKAVNSFNDFSTYYSENRIYFNQDTCIQIDSLRKKILGIYHDYSFGRSMPVGSGEGIRRFDFLTNTRKAFDEEIPPILRSIELSFRTLLAVM